MSTGDSARCGSSAPCRYGIPRKNDVNSSEGHSRPCRQARHGRGTSYPLLVHVANLRPTSTEELNRRLNARTGDPNIFYHVFGSKQKAIHVEDESEALQGRRRLT